MEIESRLLVGVNMSDAPNDKGQLGPTLAAVSPVIESLEAVLVDSGYYSAAAVAAVEQPSSRAAEWSNSWSADLRSDWAQVPWAYRPRTRAAGRSACAGPRSQRQGEDEASP